MLAYPPFESPTIIPIIIYPIWPVEKPVDKYKVFNNKIMRWKTWFSILNIACLIALFKQQFLLFKQHNTYFHNIFHSHVFSQHLNNITRITLSNGPISWFQLFLHLYVQTCVQVGVYTGNLYIYESKDIVLVFWGQHTFTWTNYVTSFQLQKLFLLCINHNLPTLAFVKKIKKIVRWLV